MLKPYYTVTLRLSASMRPLDGWVVHRESSGEELVAELDCVGFEPPYVFLEKLLQAAYDGACEVR